MSSEQPPDEPVGAAQARLDELLSLLRLDAPGPPRQLTSQIVQAAGFERGVRTAAVTAASFGAVLAEGLAVLLGLRRPR
jgi:hypothetical protein